MAVDEAVSMSVVAGVAAVSAVSVWVVNSARKPRTEPADTPHSSPKIDATLTEIAAMVVVAVMPALFLVRLLLGQASPVEAVAMLSLFGAAVLRGIRLRRAGPPVIDRLTAVLALVPGCGLLIGVFVLLLATHFSFNDEGSTYLIAGGPVLAAAVYWLRKAR
jgi:hypothetical protein